MIEESSEDEELLPVMDKRAKTANSPLPFRPKFVSYVLFIYC